MSEQIDPIAKSEPKQTTIDPSTLETYSDFRDFLNTNFTELTVASEYAVNKEYDFIESVAKLDQEELAQVLRWTAHNLHLGAAFGFPSIGTYFVSPLGMESNTAALNAFDPIKSANIGNYLQHISIQYYNAIHFSDRLERDSTTRFADEIRSQLKHDSELSKMLSYGYIRPKLGRVNVEDKYALNRINPSRMVDRLKLEAVDICWNLVGGYQSACIEPILFKSPQSKFNLIHSKIRQVVMYANGLNAENFLGVNPDVLFAAGVKITKATLN